MLMSIFCLEIQDRAKMTQGKDTGEEDPFISHLERGRGMTMRGCAGKTIRSMVARLSAEKKKAIP